MKPDPAKSLELVDSACNGRFAIAIHFHGQEVAVVRGLRRRVGNWLLPPKPKLSMSPAPQGARWTLPLPQTIDLLEDVCNRVGLQDACLDPDVSGMYDGQGHIVKIRFGKRQWAEVRRFEDGERVTIAEGSSRWMLPLLEVKSALRRALLVSRLADPWAPADATIDDFKVVQSVSGVRVLVKGEKWIEVTRRSKRGLWMTMFARLNCRPWTMPYEAVAATLAEVWYKRAVSHEKRSLNETKRVAPAKGGSIESFVCSPSEREWLIVSLADDAGMEWADVDQEGSELRIQMYVLDDLGCLELPLDQVIEHLRYAKVALLNTADRPPVRRPLVADLRGVDAELGWDAQFRAEDLAFVVRQVPSGLAMFYGDRLFGKLSGGDCPALEVEAPPDGGDWALPLPATMDALVELLTRAGLAEAAAKPREDIVFCARTVGGGTKAAIRFRGGLRAELRQDQGETRIHIGTGESNAKTWRLFLPQVVATLRWALAMLRSAEPWSETNVTSEDFATAAHGDGLELLVAGEIWGKVTPSDTPVEVEFVGRADMRPWILPYEPVIAALANAEEVVLAEIEMPEGVVFADEESVAPEEQLEVLRALAPPDRAGTVVGCYFRDEDCWVQWAEVNQSGREPQVEFYSWPGRRRFVSPIGEVIRTLRDAKAMSWGFDGQSEGGSDDPS